MPPERHVIVSLQVHSNVVMLHCYSFKLASLFQADKLLAGRCNTGLRWTEEYKMVQFDFDSMNFIQSYFLVLIH